MTDPIESIRSICSGPPEAVRWACLLEATSPKAGNVYPGQAFTDLAYVDFVAAAEIASKQLGNPKLKISQRMLSAVDETYSLTKTNVNLGIILLLGPLVAADENMIKQAKSPRDDFAWKESIAAALDRFDNDDGRTIFEAISNAAAGGLGKVDQLDISDSTPPVNIVDAMKLAEQRDRIAKQYACGFTDLIDQVVPIVEKSIRDSGDLLTGISRAHLSLLAMAPDTLIARKNGDEVAQAVQKRAQKVNPLDPTSVAKFDASLRSKTHKLNPGTTADLIAAALYVLIRTPISFLSD